MSTSLILPILKCLYSCIEKPPAFICHNLTYDIKSCLRYAAEGLVFGNSVYWIRFDEEHANKVNPFLFSIIFLSSEKFRLCSILYFRASSSFLSSRNLALPIHLALHINSILRYLLFYHFNFSFLIANSFSCILSYEFNYFYVSPLSSVLHSQ